MSKKPLSSVVYPEPHDPNFFNSINQQFFTIQDLAGISSSSQHLFPFQEFISKYMNPSSPYRGILLYYGLGAGKTRTAISACESFIRDGRKIVVLLPASLHGNFEAEYSAYTHSSKPNGLREHFSFHHYNAGPSFAKSKKTDADGSFDKEDLEGKVLIIDEMHNFVSLMCNAIRSKRYRGEAIYRKIMNTKNLRIIALSGTPIINIPFEVSILINILAGYKMSDHSQWDGTRDPIPILPESEERFNEIYLDTTNSKELKIRKEAENDFCRRLIGHISYYGGLTGKNVYPSLSEITIKVPMSNHQFNTYIQQRETEILETNSALKMENYVEKKSTGLDRELMEKKSSFRASTREICNFAFPETIPRPWRRELAKTIRTLSDRKGKTVSINKLDVELVGEEIGMETEFYYSTKKSIEQAYLGALEEAVGELRETKDIYLDSSINGVDITNAIELEEHIPDSRNEYETESKPYLVMNIKEEFNMAKISSLFGSKSTVSSSREDVDDQDIDRILANYSPKMLSILYNIEKTRLADEEFIVSAQNKDEIDRLDGNIVVYSCFNKVEGITILQYVLETSGYEEYTYSPRIIVKNPLSKGRFCFWQGDDRAKILEVFNSPENKYGDIIKILLITEAGAEGITVKNVRQMHIMEPYWNEVQIRQVIGRAKRMYSHSMLREGERHVQVYRYKMIFTSEQKDYITRNLNWRLDEKFTTDEVVGLIAQKKKSVTDQVERFMKQTAVDCFLNKADNDKHEENPLICYNVVSLTNPSKSSSNRESYKIGANVTDIVKSSRFDIEKTEKKVTKFYITRIINNSIVDPNEYAFVREIVSKKTSSGISIDIAMLKIYPSSVLRSGIIDDKYLLGKLYLISKAGEPPVFISREGLIKFKASKDLKDKVQYRQYEKAGITYLETI